MKSPALRRSAFARAIFAIVLTCVLITQPLFGAGTPALAEPTEPKVTISLKRVTEDGRLTGSENIYAVTVTCVYIDASVSDKCLDSGEISIKGIPEGWDWKKTGAVDAIKVRSSDPQLLTKVDGGTQGASWRYEFVVIPPNYVTPNNTKWQLSATLSSKAHEESLESDTVETRAAADKQLTVTKEAVDRSTAGGATMRWAVAADSYKDAVDAPGTHVPSTIEFRDVLPKGFEFKELRGSNGKKLTAYYNSETRELRWVHNTKGQGGHGHYYSTFQVLTTVDSNIPQGRHENSVTATATYVEADGTTSTKRAEGKANVTTAPKIRDTGRIRKSANGLQFEEEGTRQAGIFPRSYRDADDEDWDGDSLSSSLSKDWFDLVNDRRPGRQGSRSLVAGAYTLSMLPARNGVFPSEESPLYPLTLSYEDDVPCMDREAVEDNYLFKSRTDGNLCQKPAFHVTAVEIAVYHFSGDDDLKIGDFKPVAILNDGSKVKLNELGKVTRNSAGKEFTDSVVFSVPKEERGRVSRIVAAPNKPLEGAKNWWITIGGFPDESLPGDAILHNKNAHVQATANNQEQPFVDGYSLSADLHLLSSLHFVNTRFRSTPRDELRPMEPGNEASRYTHDLDVKFSYRGKKRDSGYVVVSNLLPRGMSPVTDSSEFRFESDRENRNPMDELRTVTFERGVSGDVQRSVKTEIIENYRDGRTLVRWKIPHEWAEADEFGNVDLQGAFRGFKARFHYSGEFTNEVYLTNTEEANPRCMDEVREDSSDIDENPNTSEACYRQADWKLSAPTGYQTLTLSKAVKGPKEDSFAYSPKRAEVGKGDGDVTYRVEAVNSSSDSMSKVVAYDVLPYKGDTGVSSNLADQKRGSTQSGSFTEMTSVPEGAEVFYSTSTNPCRPEVFPDAENKGCVNDWTSEKPSDLSSVKALKFVFEGELKPGKSLSFEYGMSVPEMGPKDVLWNSVAAKASFANGESLPAIEAPKVGAARVAEPQFAVEKKAGEATAENGEWSSTYTVTVRNTGPFEGAIPRVSDTPVLPDGFEFNKVLVDGADTNFKNGAFPVTKGEKLAPGEEKSFTVVISGKYVAKEVDWAAVATCEAGEDGAVSGGLVNKVTMEGDSDGDTNNTACNPVKKDPKFSVEKTGNGEVTAVNGEWSSTYTVTVKNPGEVKGTSQAVTDKPTAPKGFDIQKATVEGTEVVLEDGAFTVTGGEELAPGEEKSFAVVISGSFDPAKVVESEVSACAGDGAVEGAHGFVNEVTMNGDSDGEGNNTACTTVEDDPKFAVKKEASGEVTAVNGEWSSAYTVTVSNTGVLSGTSKAVTDTPALPKGFAVSNATVEGKDVALRDGSFTVTDGVELAPGKSKTFTVVISGSFDPSKVVESEVSECAGEDAVEGAHGFVNTVEMPGDSDGAENNTACATVEDDPKFAVKKEPGEASADQGSWSSTYTVTVTNTGVLKGTSQPVTDMPSAPEGFVIENVSVEGEDVALADGSFTVTDGVELAPGESKSFAVVVSGSYEPAGADWASAAKCAGEGEDSTGGGFVNQVTMNNDSDGQDNNTACNAVVKDPLFAVKKEPGEASAENGTWSSTYTVTVSNTGEVKGTSQAVTDTPRVPAGFTVTSAMVDGKKVALTGGAFTVTDGVELAFGGSKSFEVVVSGSYDAKADWAAAAACDANSGTASTGGLFNEVSMPGDSDGEGNNSACNAVDKPDEPAAPAKPAKPVKPEPGLPLPRTGAPIGLSAAAGLFTIVAGCTILVAGRRSRRS